MMLVELTTVPDTALPVAEFREHLRLGSGFADDGLQNSVLESFLKAAIAAVEGRTGKALLTRRFVWSLSRWRDGMTQPLPLAPVDTITSVRVLDRSNTATLIDPAAVHLVKETHRPKLVATTLSLPDIPWGGTAEVTFDAGFGATWAAIPSDLAQAVLMLAGHYYDNRNATSASGGTTIPFGVGALIERYRSHSVSLGSVL